jgi:hypothetical protein
MQNQVLNPILFFREAVGEKKNPPTTCPVAMPG